nr:MAG TPA_asm: hypothetical protein [Caudoviricetes sp.]
MKYLVRLNDYRTHLYKVGDIPTEASRVDRSAICRSALPLFNRVMI